MTGEAYHPQHGPHLNDYALLIFFLYQSGHHLTSICIASPAAGFRVETTILMICIHSNNTVCLTLL